MTYDQIVGDLLKTARSPASWCRGISAAKEAYELERPESKRGVAGSKKRWANLQGRIDRTRGVQRKDCFVASFSDDFAHRARLTPQIVRRYAQIGALVSDAIVAAVEAHDPLASFCHLARLVALSPEEVSKVLAELPERKLGSAIRRATAVEPREEMEFLRALLIAWGARREFTIWRQNCGSVAVRDRSGKVLRKFQAGPPIGAADIVGFTHGDGLYFEVEAKGHRTKQSGYQKARESIVLEAGATYYLARYDESRGLELSVSNATKGLLAMLSERRARRAVAW